MAATLGSIKADLLIRVGKGKPRLIGTIDIPVDVDMSQVPRARRRSGADGGGVILPTGKTPKGGVAQPPDPWKRRKPR